jgi:hypothetical protein
MAQEKNSYPLTWPHGWKRTQIRVHSKFARKVSSDSYRRRDVSINEAVDFVLGELKRMGVPDYNVIISTNLKLRNDGWPRADQREPEDRGAAVWWKDGKDERVIALDKYTTVADNLYAIGKTIEALRGIDRWGSGEILQRTFTGFEALPGPAGSTWAAVLGVAAHTPTIDVEAAYKKARWRAHPDQGGTSEQFNAVQEAFEQFKKERGIQ